MNQSERTYPDFPIAPGLVPNLGGTPFAPPAFLSAAAASSSVFLMAAFWASACFAASSALKEEPGPHPATNTIDRTAAEPGTNDANLGMRIGTRINWIPLGEKASLRSQNAT